MRIIFVTVPKSVWTMDGMTRHQCVALLISLPICFCLVIVFLNAEKLSVMFCGEYFAKLCLSIQYPYIIQSIV